jgi:hypothetical protein
MNRNDDLYCVFFVSMPILSHDLVLEWTKMKKKLGYMSNDIQAIESWMSRHKGKKWFLKKLSVDPCISTMLKSYMASKCA